MELKNCRDLWTNGNFLNFEEIKDHFGLMPNEEGE